MSHNYPPDTRDVGSGRTDAHCILEFSEPARRYFLPRKRMRVVNARPPESAKVKRCGESMLLFTNAAFPWPVMLLNPPRTAQYAPKNRKRFSKCVFKLKYAGKRRDPGASTRCCCELMTLNANPLRASTEYARSTLLRIGSLKKGSNPQESTRLGTSQG